MRLIEWASLAKPRDRARCHDFEIYMNDDGEVIDARNAVPLKLSRGYLNIDWEPVQEPLPVGEWIAVDETTFERLENGMWVILLFCGNDALLEIWADKSLKFVRGMTEDRNNPPLNRILILPDPEGAE